MGRQIGRGSVVRARVSGSIRNDEAATCPAGIAETGALACGASDPAGVAEGVGASDFFGAGFPRASSEGLALGEAELPPTGSALLPTICLPAQPANTDW
jgi:hypothetical protein